MKTKHIQYRVGLLIGLLSLNTLSSCVNTTRGLGMGPWLSKDDKNDKNVENGRGGDKNSSSKAAYYAKETVKAAGYMAVGAAIKYAYSGSTNCPSGSSSNSTQSSPWGSGRP